ncbi:redoxin domain-containing protein [Rubrobacter tropicus]|uniref:Redoxin domain-containing protein n=1 Tax=Rubrobacter tropicus TaxID=2653851 RepID=A0A6G8Q7T2_9ACTN|nr:redoxin domain-containing protein [Rubrobacter tropicus]QIN82535.1 redoxin domain-containing protein [Rubrobacter tropicus]
MFTRRKRDVVAPEVGVEAPEFNLPSAQGGQLRLSMRTVRGPVVVAFYRPGNEEDVEYFRALAAKEQEINLASGSVVGIGVAEPSAAREFARECGLKSYLLYDYARVTSSQWGLLEGDRRHGYSSRPAVFIVGPDGKVANAWTGERPSAEELLEKVSGITGLPKKPEEEKPAAEEAEAGGEKPKKMSAEEREKIKAERRAAREAGKSIKTAETSPAAPGTAAGGEQPKKMSKEERERIKAERRAARESGKSLKTDAPGTPAETPADAPKKMSAEERERIKTERRAAREAGKSVKTGASETATPAGIDGGEKAPAEASADAPKKMSKEERERIKAERRAAREAGQSLKKPSGDGSPGDGSAEKP